MQQTATSSTDRPQQTPVLARRTSCKRRQADGLRRLSSDEKSLPRSRLSNRPSPISRDRDPIASEAQDSCYDSPRYTSRPVFRSRRQGIHTSYLPRQSSKRCAESLPSLCLESGTASSNS